VGPRIIDIADPDAFDARGPRRRHQPRKPWHHLLDQRQIAPLPVHGTAFRAEIVLHVDDEDRAMLRSDLFRQCPQHRALSYGLKIIALMSTDLATSLCFKARSRWYCRLGTLNSVEKTGSVTSLTTSSFMPVNLATQSSRSSLDAVARNCVARSMARRKR